MNKVLYHSVRVHCNTDYAFAMFTENAHLQKWLTERADVEPRIGGKYELFWNPDDRENNSTIGCRITAIVPPKFLAFEWKGPPQYKDFMNTADPLTHVVVFFIPCVEKKRTDACTEIHLIHSGWRIPQEWEEARIWFGRAWNEAFKNLERYVNKE